MKYVTKTVTAHEITALVFNNDTNELEHLAMVFSGNPTEKQIEKGFSSESVKYLKQLSDNKIDELRRMTEETFTAYSHKLTANDKRQNMVTRTITEYSTVVLCYNLETDELENRMFPCKVDIKKMDLISAVPIKVVTENKKDILYGMSMDMFIALSEKFER